MAYLDETHIVLALAKAQSVLLKASQQILKRDKSDGIRAVGWLKDHAVIYDKILDDAYDMLDEETRMKAAKMAGDPSL